MTRRAKSKPCRDPLIYLRYLLTAGRYVRALWPTRAP